ncbi:hypothetical protein DPMN_142048 [Dreissena polymorpha]|uniref:Uncharacterized protein n=1 Tax=Dreissena polymorpha TaxID=45954 RepID=A0A9D4GGI5_DREPO|nr:hypothetical protein DPMN_142048 [Dreissena polymorpha]
MGDYNPGQWCINPLSGHLMGDYNPGQWCINPLSGHLMGDYNPGQWCINPLSGHLMGDYNPGQWCINPLSGHLMGDYNPGLWCINSLSGHLMGDYNPGQWCINPLSGHLMGFYNPGQWCINPWWTSHGRLQPGAMVHQSMVDISWEITTRGNGASIHGGPLMGDYNPGPWCINPWWTSHGRSQPGAMVHQSMVDLSWEITTQGNGVSIHGGPLMGDYNPGQWCINPWWTSHGRLQPGAMVHQSMVDLSWEITTRGNGASIHGGPLMGDYNPGQWCIYPWWISHATFITQGPDSHPPPPISGGPLLGR